MRRQVIDAVRALSDRTYQQRVWVERRYPHENYYDDLTHNPRAIEVLSRLLDPVLEAAGPTATDAEIIAMPDWLKVVAAARATLEVLHRPAVD